MTHKSEVMPKKIMPVEVPEPGKEPEIRPEKIPAEKPEPEISPDYLPEEEPGKRTPQEIPPPGEHVKGGLING